MEKKLDDMRKKIRKPTGDLQASRSADGMYSVPHPHSKCDLDFDDSINVHDLSTNIQDNVCGSIGDISDVSGRKEASSGYSSSAASSLSSISRQVAADDASSLSDSLNSMQSSRDNVSSDFDSQTSRDTSKDVLTLTRTEGQGLKQGQPGRKKHFIIARGQNKSFREFRGYLNKSQPQITRENDYQLDSSIATSSSYEFSDDSTFNDSFTSVVFCGDSGEGDLNVMEQKADTKVQRRKQTFIASKGVIKNFHLEMPRRNGFQKGWNTFEQILLGEDNVHEQIVAGRQPVKNTACAIRDTSQNYRDVSKRSQELVDRSKRRSSVRRSRSFDYSHGLEISGGDNCEGMNKSGDDLKLATVLQILKDPTTHQRKPFIFHTMGRNKPKQTKHFPG